MLLHVTTILLRMKMMVHVLLQQKDLTVMVTNLIVQETLLRTYHGLHDGYCDDGAFGQYLDCETFNYDDGDCGHLFH